MVRICSPQGCSAGERAQSIELMKKTNHFKTPGLSPLPPVRCKRSYSSQSEEQRYATQGLRKDDPTILAVLLNLPDFRYSSAALSIQAPCLLMSSNE